MADPPLLIFLSPERLDSYPVFFPVVINKKGIPKLYGVYFYKVYVYQTT